MDYDGSKSPKHTIDGQEREPCMFFHPTFSQLCFVMTQTESFVSLVS